MKKIVLCTTLNCHGKKCCPVVRIGKKNVTITDDFGGKVKMTHEQYNVLMKEGQCVNPV